MNPKITLALVAAGLATTATISYMVGKNVGENRIIKIVQSNLIQVMGEQLKEEMAN